MKICRRQLRCTLEDLLLVQKMINQDLIRQLELQDRKTNIHAQTQDKV